MVVREFEELEVYKLGLDLQQAVFVLTRSFPREETYSLTDQIRRSSRSIGANIAEAWVKRRYVAHFVMKLTDSDGEAKETRHWLTTALQAGYIDAETHEELSQQCKRIGQMLGRMMADAEHWCMTPRH